MADPAGQTLFTGVDVSQGQKVFLHNGLMEYGSIFGHGAYLGPDFTDDYLHRAALSVQRQYKRLGIDGAVQRTISDFQANRYDPDTTRSPLPRPRVGRSGDCVATTPTTSATRRGVSA